MSEITEFSLSDLDENTKITGLEEHCLKVKVSFCNTNLTEHNTLPLSSLKNQPSLPPKTSKRSSSISEIPKNPSKLSRHSSGHSVRSRNKSPFDPSHRSPAQNPIAQKFEAVFNEATKTIELTKNTSKETFTDFLQMIGFSKAENSDEIDDLFKLFKTNPSPEYSKDLLLRILSLTELKKDSSKLKERFPGLFKSFFNKKAAKVSHNIENYETVADYLLSYQKNLENKLVKTKEKLNSEKFKECTFKPEINKLSKVMDSTPKKENKGKNPYLALKAENNARTEALYEFAGVSRHLKNETIKTFLNEEALKCPFAPAINLLRPGANTPVKGLDEAVKRLQKARTEKEWKDLVMERGVPILSKDKENSTKAFDLISELEIELANGMSDKISYYKGSNMNFIISEFCLKHKLSPNLHEKLTKIILKSKGREQHKLL